MLKFNRQKTSTKIQKMRKKGEYEQFVKNFYLNQDVKISKIAFWIIKMHYSIPLEASDLICYSYYKMLEGENKLNYYKLKNEKRNDINNYFKNKIKFYMLTYCNIFKTKDHQILNNSLSNDYENIIDLFEGNYDYEEMFDFLSKQEFDVIYEIYVNKIKRKELSFKLNISVFKLKKIENEALKKIYEKYK